jgi:hypothetical protein
VLYVVEAAVVVSTVLVPQAMVALEAVAKARSTLEVLAELILVVEVVQV